MKVPAIHRRVFVIFRRRRMKKFYEIFQPSLDTRVLDIGGAPNTWLVESRYGAAFPVTLVNLRFPDRDMLTESRFSAVEGDATQLPFPDASFEIVFSNSVIEHMTTMERQQAFASEARRVAKRIWIQTPARSFPIEPHLLTPFFQYFPSFLQKRMVRHFTLWGLLTKPSPAEVEEMLCDIRLLTYREMKRLFPDCKILRERILGITKSYIAIRMGE
jgi:hypothetical protein